MTITYYVVKTFKLLLVLLMLVFLSAAAGMAFVWFYVVPQLPDPAVLQDIRLKVPLRIYSSDKRAIAEYGEERRTPLAITEMPPMIIKAVLAAEDDEFYEHPGIDAKGVLRAALNVLKTGQVKQGASTITMQLARNFFLTNERTLNRKLKEVLLALQIESLLEKDQILELYLNKIFLGHRTYGFGAAAHTYYGKPPAELTLAQIAMLAGLPKAPSAYNPLRNPERALLRRDYVLNRMHQLQFISDRDWQAALEAPISAVLHGFERELEAPYVAEMVRDHMYQTYGDEAYTAGYQVYVTLRSDLQQAARSALRNALQEYDVRHGYRGAYGETDLTAVPATENQGEIFTYWNRLLADKPVYEDLLPAVVLEVQEKSATVYATRTGIVDLGWKGLKWARPYINDRSIGQAPKKAADILRPGETVFIYPLKTETVPADSDTPDSEPVTKITWRLAQIPQIEGALVALDPDNGAILALQGGFDYYRSKFNRVTQAERQPGSNFKPFIYSAALEFGKTPASLINDAPLVFSTRGRVWRPENYSKKVRGPTRLREALKHSLNLISIRLAYELGLPPVREYTTRFGFPIERLPRDLTLALGTASVKPLEVARGFAVFANGGHRVEPYIIERIEAYDGTVVHQAKPRAVCHACSLPVEPGLPGVPMLVAAAEAADTNEAGVETATDALPEVPPPVIPETVIPVLADTAAEIEPLIAHLDHAPRVITAQNAWLMTSMLKDVITGGTAKRALSLHRSDLAGKTGTTNDQYDAWFSGYNAELVATAWVGFDRPRSLGRAETGGRAALPVWIEFMRAALKDRPTRDVPRPGGLTTVRIDPATGLLAGSDFPGAIYETFRSGNVPTRSISHALPSIHGPSAGGGGAPSPDQIF